MNRHTHNLLVVKGCLSVGFFALILLPPDMKEWAAVAVNMLWLWKGGE